jgi:hypothetical protein
MGILRIRIPNTGERECSILWRRAFFPPVQVPTKLLITKFLITKFLITKFLITKFLITKFLISKFLTH